MSFVKLLTKPLLAAIIMGLAIVVLQIPVDFMYRLIEPSRLTAILITIILVGVGGFTYIYLMILIGGIKKEDIETVSPKLIRIMPRFMRMKLR